MSKLQVSFIKGWIKDVELNRVEKSEAIQKISVMFCCSTFKAMVLWNNVYELSNN